MKLVDKNNLNGQYKILFSTPQTPNSNIPKEFRGLQIFPNKLKAEEALRNRKKLTKFLKKNDQKEWKEINEQLEMWVEIKLTHLVQYSPQVQKLKNDKIKRAKELYKEGYKKSEILRIIIKI